MLLLPRCYRGPLRLCKTLLYEIIEYCLTLASAPHFFPCIITDMTWYNTTNEKYHISKQATSRIYHCFRKYPWGEPRCLPETVAYWSQLATLTVLYSSCSGWALAQTEPSVTVSKQHWHHLWHKANNIICLLSHSAAYLFRGNCGRTRSHFASKDAELNLKFN